MELEAMVKVTFDTLNNYSLEITDPGFNISWDDLPKDKQHLHHQLVQMALDNEELMPEGVHEYWMRNKLKNGWEFGFSLDRENKKSPHIVDFGDLPKEIKGKSYLFLGMIKILRNFLD